MIRIDAHQHFWQYNPVRDSWITDDMEAIKRDFMPADLAPVLQKWDIDGCVTVQSDQSTIENQFQLKNAQQNNFIKGIVGWVDFRSADINDQLSDLKKQPKLKGFRHVLQGEADRALMLKPTFINGIRALARHGFTYDILIFPDQLTFAAELAGLVPDQLFVLNHIAKPDIKNQKINGWEQDIKKLAGMPNVYCKISGMVTEADWQNWVPADFTPYLDVVFNVFGIDRLMFGSDWPVCLVAGGYDKMLNIITQYTSKLSADEQGKFFGLNAVKFYNL